MRDDFIFTVDDLAMMREAQTDHMLDECVILSYAAGTANEYNEADAPVYTAGNSLICGIDMRSGSERHGQEMTVIQYDATLRLPIETLLKETDRVQIISRFCEYHAYPMYEIVSPIQRGPSGIRVLLRKIVT
jgi:hypothetical protein